MDGDTPFIHLFKTLGGHYIYDVNRNAIIKTQKSTYDYLQQKSLKNSINVENDLIKTMKDKGFLSSKKVKEILHPEDDLLENSLYNKLKMLTLQVTQQCNLRCEYCVYSGGYLNRGHTNARMSFETAKKGIDFLIHHSMDVERVNVGFYGGEPLLEFELVKKCILYALEISEGKTVTFSMTTNGTLFTREILEFLSLHDVNIAISLDGPREVHDKNRKFAVSGCGTFNKVSKNLEFFRENYPEYFKKVLFNVVLDRKNNFSCIDEFFSTYDIISESIINALNITTNYSQGQIESYEDYDIKMKYEYFKMLLSKINRLDAQYVSKLLFNDYERLKTSFVKERQHTRELPDRAHHGGPCVPGVQRLFMDVNGNFYPCERVSENSEIMRIGHVDTGFDLGKVRKILNIGKLTEKSCKNCWAFRFCTLCAATADDTVELSADKKQSNCNSVRVSQEESLKDYCTLIEFGHSFEDNNGYYVMEG